MNDSKPLVSVCMITYNHEKYIAEAIEGVLMQKTDFPIELVIGEDCSTDNTRIICERYVSRFPKLIKVLSGEENFGVTSNIARTLDNCSGTYVAICEGDDYWIDEGKLQKQVDILLTDADVSGICHNVRVQEENGDKALQLTAAEKEYFSFEDMLWRRVAIGTASIMFRAEALENVPDDLPLYDWVLHLLITKHGRLRYIDEVMSVYRRHDQGWTNHFSLSKAQDFVRMTERCATYFGEQYREAFNYWLGHSYADVCFTSYEISDRQTFDEAFKKCRLYWKYIPRRKKIALLLRSTFFGASVRRRG